MNKGVTEAVNKIVLEQMFKFLQNPNSIVYVPEQAYEQLKLVFPGQVKSL
jgi:hypothetical protein